MHGVWASNLLQHIHRGGAWKLMLSYLGTATESKPVRYRFHNNRVGTILVLFDHNHNNYKCCDVHGSTREIALGLFKHANWPRPR
jgi:hypothetical protein